MDLGTSRRQRQAASLGRYTANVRRGCGSLSIGRADRSGRPDRPCGGLYRGTRELFRVFLDSASELSEHSANVAGTAGVGRIQRARAGFFESGRPGVDWLRPAYPTMQETPYSFHKPEEFSCRPNRGGTLGSLFLLNHWINTKPTPKPSKAAVVNVYSELLGRAEECEKERHHLPNIVAVDFYRMGDLLRVVNHLNGLDQTQGEGSK
ncbi:MAG: hypothetical protein JOY85_20425 [Acidobacteriaceae bacterium]|nr:hypothetical protein [Acidobacteriaceae bacterium]